MHKTKSKSSTDCCGRNGASFTVAQKALSAQPAEAQKQAHKADEQCPAMEQSRDVIDTQKQIGLNSDQSADAHNGVFPKAFEQFKSKMTMPLAGDDRSGYSRTSCHPVGSRR